ncbi:hypothetical protein NDU88_006081 [Pleurodeles waltl]|uniref:Uncharacterized protein n=1 Tax=Pleurodeles waltl TaxID=8319 RepID=A0AAV7NP84_PLEWA|nr:hypothetical protein NDU88_006081 [Pleurodeles waltl]
MYGAAALLSSKAVVSYLLLPDGGVVDGRQQSGALQMRQINSEGDRRKHERTAKPLKGIAMKLQNVRVPATVESDAALNEPGTSYGNNTIFRVLPTQDPLNTPTCSTVQPPSKGSEERALPIADIPQ